MDTSESHSAPHVPVLYQKTIQAITPLSPGKYVDCTVGAGGHAWGILQASSPAGQLLGLDLDPRALDLANQRLVEFRGRFKLIHASYTSLMDQLQVLGWQNVNGILLDLGVSSMQIDTPERGFSFMADGPLDMRFDPNQSTSAADLVNDLDERDLADLIWRYGEDRKSRQIARAIVAARPIFTTHELAEVIRKAVRSGNMRIHPATRTFQALRITVNRELEAVETVLPKAIEALAPAGRLVVISFHSLEDRIVKQLFQRESRDCICPPEQPVCTCQHKAVVRLITRHPIEADEEEIKENPRARSARLSVVEKLIPA
jgi:16S rRNA (cytosine1402-N4)-methyltransferase